ELRGPTIDAAQIWDVLGHRGSSVRVASEAKSGGLTAARRQCAHDEPRGRVPSMAVIETRGLTKQYGLQLAPALADLDLTVEPGEIFGFLGPNGAGKSTTIRLLLRFCHPRAR